jgi:ATP-binding cassette subfamily B protein
MIRNIARAVKEIYEIHPFALVWQVLSGIMKSGRKYVNVVMLARIAEALYSRADARTLFVYAAITVGLNFVLTIVDHLTDTGGSFAYWRLQFTERHRVNDVMRTIDYRVLEDVAFDTLVRKYKETLAHSGGHLCSVGHGLYKFTLGIVTTGISVYLLAPFFRQVFVKTGMSFFGSPWFTASVIGFIIAAAISIFFFQRQYNRTLVKTREKLLGISKRMEYYTEILRDYSNGKEIRLYDMQDLISRDASETLIKEGNRIRRNNAKKQGRNSAWTAIIGVAASFGVYLLIGMKGLAGAFDISDLVLYSGTFLLLVHGIISLTDSISYSTVINRSIRYYFDILDYPHKHGYVKKGNLKKEKELPEGFEIEFDNVSFRYPSATEYALRHLSLKINRGEKIAIVGQNGSGKTTFIKLLCKLYSDYEGTIRFNGVDIREIDDETYRRMFSVVFQDYKIFSFTVGENVAASEAYDSGAVLDALEKAGVQELLPGGLGLSAYLGKDFDERGIDIAGGESQKLATARAFYKDTECLILDEPTASLDPIAEAEFYNRFNTFSQEKTVLYISHRLSSCVFCRRILVFQNGELIQNGTHEELLKKRDAKYYELWNAQVKYYL